MFTSRYNHDGPSKYAATKDLELHSGDISAAFLQGAPIERVLLLKTPKDGIRTEKEGFIEAYTYLIALMSVYGSKDAPRGFWLELRQELVAQRLTEIDPAFYVLLDEGETCGLLCSHWQQQDGRDHGASPNSVYIWVQRGRKLQVLWTSHRLYT